MSPRLCLLVAFGLIGVVLTVPSWRSSVAAKLPQSGLKLLPVEDALPPENVPHRTIDVETPVVASPAQQLLLPTGETVPVLNGALGAPPLQWAAGRPWSPIVGTETDPNGNEWYMHEDGTRTITQIVYDRGEPVAATSVAHPVPSRPLEEGSGKGDGRIRD